MNELFLIPTWRPDGMRIGIDNDGFSTDILSLRDKIYERIVFATDMASRWDADGIDYDGFSTDILSLRDKIECCLGGDDFGYVNWVPVFEIWC